MNKEVLEEKYIGGILYEGDSERNLSRFLVRSTHLAEETKNVRIKKKAVLVEVKPMDKRGSHL